MVCREEVIGGDYGFRREVEKGKSVCVCVLGLGYIKKEHIHEHRTYTQTQECGRLLSASPRTTAQASKLT